MGTHPIFESDFDCLTEMPPKRVPPKKAASKPAPVRPTPGGNRPVGRNNKSFVPGKSGVSNKGPQKVQSKKKEPTKEELAVIVIQKYTRRLLAKKILDNLRLKKLEYEELIDKLQQQ